MPYHNEAICLVDYIVASPSKTHFTIKNSVLTDDDLKQDELLIKNHWISVDPYMRGRMTDRASYVPPFLINHPIEGSAIGEVVASNSDEIKVGQLVLNSLGWQRYGVTHCKNVMVLPSLSIPEQAFLGSFGMPGFTAWVGLTKIAQITQGKKVFISSAAGAVGQIACQIARNYGCTVSGTTGSKEGVLYLQDKLNISDVFCYKSVSNYLQALKEVAPYGIDVYFDNVGGSALNAALQCMNTFGTIISCGMISQYNQEKSTTQLDNLAKIIGNRLRIQGFIVTDYWGAYSEFFKQMEAWYKKGQIEWEETIYQGLSSSVEAFLSLFYGHHKGKIIVKLD